MSIGFLVVVVVVGAVVGFAVHRAQQTRLAVAFAWWAAKWSVIIAWWMFRWSVRIALAAASLAVYARRGHARHGAVAWLRSDRDLRNIAAAHGWEKPGRVLVTRPSRVGHVMTVKLPGGVVIDDLNTAKIASATMCSAAVVRTGPIPRIVKIAVRRGRDPLSDPVACAPLGEGCPDLERLVIGVQEDGAPWTLPLLGSHVLVGGVTGSGKGSVIWGLVRAIAPGIQSGHVRVLALDPKGGMELAFGKPLFGAFMTRDRDMQVALRVAVEEMEARAERLAGVTRLHTPTPEEPLIVVLIDEVASLTAYHPDQRVRLRYANLISMLLSQGRAVGVSVVMAVQDPRKEVIPMRALVPIKVALRLDEAQQVPMVLGDGARKRGAEADWIDPALPGVGYVVADGTRDPVRVRAAHVTDDEIRQVCTTYATGDADTSTAAHDTFGVRASAPAPAPPLAPAREGGVNQARSSAGSQTPRRRETRAERKRRNRASWPGHRRDAETMVSPSGDEDDTP